MSSSNTAATDLKCPICLDFIQEAYLTTCCGNSFCHSCISEHISGNRKDLRKKNKSCPVCFRAIDLTSIIPNKAFDSLMKQNTSNLKMDSLSPMEVEERLLLLQKRHKENDQDLRLILYHQFLCKSKAQKLQALERLSQEIASLSSDLEITSSQMSLLIVVPPSTVTSLGSPEKSSSSAAAEIRTTPARVPEASNQNEDQFIARKRLHAEISDRIPDLNDDLSVYEGLPPSLRSVQNVYETRLLPHFEDLQLNYFASKLPSRNGTEQAQTDSSVGRDSQFANDLLKCSKFSGFKTLASLHFADSFFTYTSSIVSSIEFDKDDEKFATGGVTKKIKLFDFESVTSIDHSKTLASSFITRTSRDAGVNHLNSVKYSQEGEENQFDQRRGESNVALYPIKEMTCSSKISCLSWGSYVKRHLLSSDYEGVVSLWDANLGSCVQTFSEHERRAWSVDFSSMNPAQFASGGDDSKVKLWSTNQNTSTGTLHTKANITSVKFSPTNSYIFAFGSADHDLYVYDLRNIRSALTIFGGHRKAVSYVKFLNSSELVTASTDSTLRLWSLKDPSLSPPAQRVYSGHTNEKNFVGLSVSSDGQFISCGSESNQVFAYYSTLSTPIASHSFGNNLDPVTGLEVAAEDPNSFVSSICWKRKTPDTLVAANSNGRIKIMQLTA